MKRMYKKCREQWESMQREWWTISFFLHLLRSFISFIFFIFDANAFRQLENEIKINGDDGHMSEWLDVAIYITRTHFVGVIVVGASCIAPAVFFFNFSAMPLGSHSSHSRLDFFWVVWYSFSMEFQMERHCGVCILCNRFLCVRWLLRRCWKSISVFGAWRRKQWACASHAMKVEHIFLQTNLNWSFFFFFCFSLWRFRSTSVWSIRSCKTAEARDESHGSWIQRNIVSPCADYCCCYMLLRIHFARFFFFICNISRSKNFSSHGNEIKTLKIKLSQCRMVAAAATSTTTTKHTQISVRRRVAASSWRRCCRR